MKSLSDIISVVVISMVVIGVAIFLLNPSLYEFSFQRDEQRKKDVAALATALSTAKKAGIPVNIPVSASCFTEKKAEICRTAATDCTDLLDITAVVDAHFLTAIPTDPVGINEQGSGYNAVQNSQGIITVCAPFAEKTDNKIQSQAQ